LIDGQTLSQTASEVNINFTYPGNHQIQISAFRQVFPFGIMTQRILYSGNIYIQPGQMINATVEYNGRFNVLQNQNYQYQGNSYPAVNSGSYGHCGRNGNGKYYNNNYNNGYSYNGYMNEGSFQNLKQSLRAKGFDDTRKTMAIQALRSNNLSAAQVSDLLGVFSFESTRLEVAKEAWNVSRDRSNFYLVNNSFTFSSSIDELNQYMQTHG